MSPEEALDRLRGLPTFGTVVSQIDDAISSGLAEYRPAAESLVSAGPKAVKDAIWGMIDLEPGEVAIVDTPQFQRLRRIRQLGLGYLTYPTAGYSRFEHSLGALHQAERMLLAIAARSPESLRNEIVGTRRATRLAALLHDIGHLPLSHVTERYFTEAESSATGDVVQANALVDDVAAELKVPTPHLAECLSLAVILTPSFTQLLTQVCRFDVRDVVTAALAIVGRPFDTRLAFVTQIITNIVDADKMDYMFRDAWVTRVPVAVDLERFLYKLKCIDEDVGFLPESMQRIAPAGQRVLVLGTDVAGDRLAYDVTQARSMLFQRVYLHHKTRAAERVALRILEHLRPSVAEAVALDDQIFGNHSATSGDPIRPLVQRLLDRRLPRRAFALSYSFLPHSDGEVKAHDIVNWSRLTGDLGVLSSRALLEDAILQQARTVGVAANQATTGEVWIDTPPNPPEAGRNDLLVELPDGSVRKGITPLAPEAAAGTHDPSDIFFAYVTGQRDADESAFVATELVLKGRYGLHFGRNAADYAKMSLDTVNALKRTLERREPSFFSGAGELRPPSAYIRSSAARDVVSSLAGRFAQFNVSASTVDAEKIIRFIDQFPEDLAEPALRMLSAVRFLSRDTLGTTLAGHLRDVGGDSAIYVPLTRDPQESASHLSYFLKDIAELPPVESIDQALEKDQPLVIFDDCIISGYQATGVLKTWMGRSQRTETPKALRLSEAQQERLKDRQVHYCFAFGTPKGMSHLEAEFNDCGLQGSISALEVETRERPLDVVGPDSGRLRAFLAEVGYELLVSTNHETDSANWNLVRCASRALGWGNDEQLVVMAYGVPLGTITALWKAGSYRGCSWLPLFPHRRELQLLLRSQ